MITGNDLINLGFKPAKWFKEAIEHINENDLSGDAMLSYLDSVKPLPAPPMIPLHAQPVKYFVNITAETELEKENLTKVTENMNELLMTPTSIIGSIMPDACPAGQGTIPVGGVVATKNSIHPGYHSADVCCSLMLTNVGKVEPKLVLDAASKYVHFGPGGRGKSNPFRVPRDLMKDIESNSLLNSKKSIDSAIECMGTQGASNHFYFVGISKKTGDTVIVSHHGSRNFGALLYKKGMDIAEGFRKKISSDTLPKNAWIPFDTDEGREYWKALQIVREWTKQNHMCIHDKIVEKLKLTIEDRFWNEHNFVFKDGDIFYHAKGATPVDTKYLQDLIGPQIIPLNMSQSILLVRGTTTGNNLGFACHGAGRNFSRSEHKKNNAHKTSEEILKEETTGIDVRFFSGQIDISELPSAYKNANEVKRQIIEFNLATVVDEILPYGTIMCGHIEEHWRKKKMKKLQENQGS